jgi:thiol-disulfide isomerase/thioredoxin
MHAPLAAGSETAGQGKLIILFFWGEGCPHCAAAKPFLKGLEKKYPQLEIRSYEVLGNENNLRILEETAKSRGADVRGVPAFFINSKVFEGFNDNISRDIEAAVREGLGIGREPSGGTGGIRKTRDDAQLTVPLFGKTAVHALPLPAFTVVIAAFDSFNPCAFFVLFTLLSLLAHAHSRKRMLLIGGVFVFFSGCFYFIFMATWLNLFFIVGHLAAVTWVAGILALAIALINLKDFFFYKKGISLTISDASKPKLYERMRGLVRADSFTAALAGSIVLSIAANSYELLCTAGFPMVYTRVLTLNSLSPAGYYAYLALYNIIYVIPLAAIVVFFLLTMGSRKLTERQGRILKLVSGLMMLGLAIVLIVDPSILQSALASALLLLGVLAAAAVTVLMMKKFKGF